MPVQGSTQAFPVRGLLELLSTTGRTGRLVVHIAPRLGLVALRDGRLVGAATRTDDTMPTLTASPSATALGDVLADVLAWPPGRFAFHPDGVAGSATGFDVAEALAAHDELEQRFGADHPLGPTHRVVLVGEPGFRCVHIDQEHWPAIVAIGDGCTIDDLARSLHTGLPTARRRVDALVALGLAETHPPLAAAA